MKKDMQRAQEEMKKALTLTPALAANLASVVVHAGELISPSGHHLDMDALNQACNDKDLQAWLKALGPLAPVLRRQGHSALRVRNGEIEKFDPHENKIAAAVTKYSNKILELDGANMEQQEIPLLLTEFVRELQGRPKA